MIGDVEGISKLIPFIRCWPPHFIHQYQYDVLNWNKESQQVTAISLECKHYCNIEDPGN